MMQHTPYTSAHFMFNTAVASDSGEPKTFKEVLELEDPVEKERWTKLVVNEARNFIQRNTWSNYPRVKVKEEGKKMIGTKLVFKKEIEAEGSKAPDTYGVHGHKTRGVTLGYQLIPGIDYTESHSHVANDTSVRMAIAITLYHDDWDIHVIDIEAVFLEQKLKKPLYIEWLPRMVEMELISQEDADKYVCLLTGGFYGNMQVALAFFQEYREHFTKEINMKQSLNDPFVFYLRDERDNLVLLAFLSFLHVNDTLVAGEPKWIDWYKKMVGTRFK